MKLNKLLGWLQCPELDCHQRVQIQQVKDDENEENNNRLQAQCEGCEFKQFMPRAYKPKSDPKLERNQFVDQSDL